MESFNTYQFWWRKRFAVHMWRIVLNSMPILKDFSIPGVLVVTAAVACYACNGFNSQQSDSFLTDRPTDLQLFWTSPLLGRPSFIALSHNRDLPSEALFYCTLLHKALLSRIAANLYHSLHSQIKSCQRALYKWRMQVRFLHFQKLSWVPPLYHLHWKRLSSAFY